MIVVRVELWSAVTRKKTTLALMSISNVGGTHTSGDYHAETYVGRSEAALVKALVSRRISKSGEVIGHPRLKEHVWNLVGKALSACGYRVS